MKGRNVKQGKGYAVIGFAVAALIAGLLLVTNEQNQIPNPEVSQSPLPTPTPQSDSTFDEWLEQPVTFRDSDGNIPDIMTSQEWTNGDALQACTIMLEAQPIVGESNDPDVNWCQEFVEASPRP